MNLQYNKNMFAQLSDKSRTVLTKATALVNAEHFSRGKEIRKSSIITKE